MKNKKVMELKDTIDLMNSSDYKDRFIAEYWQTRIRHEKLKSMLNKYLAGTLDFKPTCPYDTLKHQEVAMHTYLFYLETRAVFEGIDIFKAAEKRSNNHQ